MTITEKGFDHDLIFFTVAMSLIVVEERVIVTVAAALVFTLLSCFACMEGTMSASRITSVGHVFTEKSKATLRTSEEQQWKLLFGRN